MIYVLCGEEPYLIEKKLNELIATNGGEKLIFSGDDWDDLAVQCQEISLFAPTRIILVKDPLFLSAKSDEHRLKALLSYCNKPNYETDLIFYTYENSFDLRLKTAKEVLKNAQLLRFDRYKETAFRNYVMARIKESSLTIERDAIEVLIKMSVPSITLFERNLELLLLYPQKVDKKVVAALCTPLNEETIFDFIDLLLAKNFKQAYKLAKRLLKDNGSVIGFVSVLASQLRFLYQVAYFAAKGFSRERIAETMNVGSTYRISKALEKLVNLNRKELLHMLNELALLEYNLKTSANFDENFLFEMFMMEFTK